MNIFWWIVDRLKEPSTYAGMAGIFAALGISQELSGYIASAGMGIAGIVAVVLHENKAPPAA